MNIANDMHRVDCGRTRIVFELRRTDRKTLEIRVEPDGRVLVTAPRSAGDDLVAARVRARGAWISRQLHAGRLLPPPSAEKLYRAGESHRFLGRHYRLHLSAGRAHVTLRGGLLELALPEASDPMAVAKLLERWYRAQAKRVFAERLDRAEFVMASLRLARPRYEVRSMPNRWGSCTPSGKLLLNPQLVRAPIPCIDYVVAHELCHLVTPHHGEVFWRTLDRVLPDWRRWRDRLARLEL